MIPGTALIATVFQEGQGIRRWLDALAAQTVAPEEIVIVDGESTDDTLAQIAGYPWPAGFPKPRIVVQRCNIAAGRNLAVRSTAQPLIISSDAGSLPETRWLEKMTAPLARDPGIDVVGGRSVYLLLNDFQQRLAPYLGSPVKETSDNVMPSSRCIAFRREAWEAVGGYPEWLTLTAEDALFNHNLRAAGLRFYYEPEAVVAWEARPDLESFLKMIHQYGFGWAEARFDASQHWRWMVTVLLPPLILFSRNPLRDALFRYRRNWAGSSGWIMGALFGHRPPPGWVKRNGVLLSPQTVRFLQQKSARSAHSSGTTADLPAK